MADGLFHLVKAGLCEKAKKAGVEYINIFAVDNVCQRMADPCFVGAMIDGSDIRSAAKVVSKATPEEQGWCTMLMKMESHLLLNIMNCQMK